MKKLVMFIFFAGIIAFSLSSCATTGTGKAEKKTGTVKTMEVTLKPSRLYEHCLELNKNNKMNYSFESENLLNFYIHYHEEGSKIELDRSNKVAALEGVFSPEKETIYCLTWTNPQSNPVDIKYSYTITEKK